MNVALRHRTGLSDFLDWEERQELRYEFDGVAASAMVGGTAAHAVVQSNLIAALTSRLRDKPCQPFGSALEIAVAGSIRYPDAFVVCTPVAPKARVVADPVVIFEVLSETTARVDHVTKNAEYRATDRWVGSLLTGDAMLAMPDIGIEVPLGDLYDGLDLSQSASEATA